MLTLARISCLAVLTVLSVSVVTAAEPKQSSLSTAHYDIYAEDADLQRVGAVVEALYAELKGFFGVAPPQRLSLKIYADQARYARAVEAIGIGYKWIVDAAGVYATDNGACYVWVAPGDPRETDERIIHECTHQFQFLARGLRKPVPSRYYVEGLAERFSVHQRQGANLRFGMVPDVEPYDLTTAALRAFADRHHNSFRALASDPAVDPDYAEAWALVAFLISAHREQFDWWSKLLDGGASAELAWKGVFFRADDQRISQEFVRWIKQQQRPWASYSGSFRSLERQASFECVSAPSDWAIALMTSPVTSMSWTAEATSPQTLLATLVGYTSREDYQIIEVTADGRVWVCDHDHWFPDKLENRIKVNNPRKVAFNLSVGGGWTIVFIDGVEAVRLCTPEGSNCGPAAYNGRAVLTSLKANRVKAQ